MMPATYSSAVASPTVRLKSSLRNEAAQSANIAYLLQAQAVTRPDAVAIIDRRTGRIRSAPGKCRTTFAELERAAAQGAALLEAKGLHTGDAVLVFLPMSVELYAVLGAIFRLGLTAMFVDPSAGRAHLERCCALYPPKALIAGPRAHLLRLVSTTLARIPHKFVVGPPLPGATSWSRAAGVTPRDEIAQVDPDWPALVTFTSGSTGEPKATARSHRFLIAQHGELTQTLRAFPGDTALATMPIVLLSNLAAGVTSLIPRGDLRHPGRIKPAPIIEQMQEHGVTSAVASPVLLDCVASKCIARGVTLSGLRKVYTGGAPVFPRTLDRLTLIAPKAEITALYGSTEAEPIAELRRVEIEADDRLAMLEGHGLLAGMPTTGTKLRIIADRWGTPIDRFSREEFEAESLPPDEPGEIVVSGDHVLRGYLGGRGDAETKIVVDDEIWHRTGDAGYLDRRGRLWLLGRCSARLSCDPHVAGPIYPLAVEAAVIAANSSIRRAACVARKGGRLLVIETERSDGEVDPEAIRRSIPWARIDEVLLCPRIPVDGRHNAKIDYPALHALLESRDVSTSRSEARGRTDGSMFMG